MEEEKDKTEKQGQISRREFLKDAGLIVGGATVGSMAILSACGGGETATETKTQTVTNTKTVTNTTTITGGTGSTATTTVTITATPPGAETENIVKFTVNEQEYKIQVQPRWTLDKVLREQLGLTGVKRGCEEGACGVCTVLINGKPVLSCLTLAIECNGRSIETIEGLSKNGVLHPMQQAFWENFGFECGYCTPGQILTAKALASKNPNPSEQDVRKALSGNICKCGGYQQIVASVMAGTKKMREA